ncbi:MAG: BREX-3 system P-loop-containing protein BrxF [Acetomicrobium sp.]|nr:BREX-3 system P-loop-containing protein BrxF [Acetomicrobium sp.]
MESITSQILSKIDEVYQLYYRLILLVGPAGSGKTNIMKQISINKSCPLINVNLSLSRRLLDLSERKRILKLPDFMSEIIDLTNGDLVLLDNIELLFDVRLKHDPLRLLQGISRNVTVVSTWNGSITSGHLIYASPGHPEYHRYPIESFLVVSMR